MEFVNNTITPEGIFIAAKSLAGQRIRFTKIVMGDGLLGDKPVEDVKQIISPKATVDITKKEVVDSRTAVIGGIFSNRSEKEGFYWRELGLYAEDPDDGREVLFSYGNCGDMGEWIPAIGGQTLIEKVIDILTYVGSAANIEIYVREEAWATQAQFEEWLALLKSLAGSDFELLVQQGYFAFDIENDDLYLYYQAEYGHPDLEMGADGCLYMNIEA